MYRVWASQPSSYLPSHFLLQRLSSAPTIPASTTTWLWTWRISSILASCSMYHVLPLPFRTTAGLEGCAETVFTPWWSPRHPILQTAPTNASLPQLASLHHMLLFTLLYLVSAFATRRMIVHFGPSPAQASSAQAPRLEIGGGEPYIHLHWRYYIPCTLHARIKVAKFCLKHAIPTSIGTLPFCRSYE